MGIFCVSLESAYGVLVMELPPLSVNHATLRRACSNASRRLDRIGNQHRIFPVVSDTWPPVLVERAWRKTAVSWRGICPCPAPWRALSFDREIPLRFGYAIHNG